MSGTNFNRFLLPQTGASTTASKTSTHQSPNQKSSFTNNSNDDREAAENELSVDTDFDAFWEEEARNPNRNRIRIGRQYQATVPPLIKTTGEKEKMKLEELETLSFCPKKSAHISDSELEHYFTIAKSLNLFASLVETRSLLGRDVTIADLNHIRHKEGLNLAAVIQSQRHQQSQSSVSSSTNAINGSNLTTSTSSTQPPDPAPAPTLASSKDINNSNVAATEQSHVDSNYNQPFIKALTHFISLHHPCYHVENCKKMHKESASTALLPKEVKLGRSRSSIKQLIENSNDNQTESWTQEDIELFSKATEICGKNFSSIKREFLPSKSVKSILEYYYIGTKDNGEGKRKPGQSSDSTNEACSSTSKAGIDASLMSVYNFDEFKEESPPSNTVETEVKPLKAKPVVPSSATSLQPTHSNVGSLKFFMDGQLVLKLNACHEQLEGERCQWVESGEKAESSLSQKQKRYTKRTNSRLTNCESSIHNGSRSNSIVSSYQDEEDSKQDELSADEDSKESNASTTPNQTAPVVQQINSVQKPQPSPQLTRNPVKKLKVKAERSSPQQPQSTMVAIQQQQQSSQISQQQTQPPNQFLPPPLGLNYNCMGPLPNMMPNMSWFPNNFAMQAAALLFQNTHNNLGLAPPKLERPSENLVSNMHLSSSNTGSNPIDLSLDQPNVSKLPVRKNDITPKARSRSKKTIE